MAIEICRYEHLWVYTNGLFDVTLELQGEFARGKSCELQSDTSLATPANSRVLRLTLLEGLASNPAPKQRARRCSDRQYSKQESLQELTGLSTQ